MPRLNLYDYRAKQAYYRRLREYCLLAAGLIVAVLINLTLYGLLQLKISTQQRKNLNINQEIMRIKLLLQPISTFKRDLIRVQAQEQLLQQLQQHRALPLKVLQQLSALLPETLYFTALQLLDSGIIHCSGVSRDPQQLANFLANLRSSMFSQVELNPGRITNEGGYHFTINAVIKAHANL